MRCITIRQPWAAAIAEAEDNPAGKLVENRAKGFPHRYRGIVGIHAGSALSVRGAQSRLVHRVVQDRYDDLPRGAVVAVADLVDVHPSAGCCQPWGEDSYPYATNGQPVNEVKHLVLERVLRINPPVDARGRLGLWHPDEDLLVEVCHRLADRVDWDYYDAARLLADRGDIDQLVSIVADDIHGSEVR